MTLNRPANEDARRALLGKRFAAAIVDGLVGIIFVIAFGWIHASLGALAGGAFVLLRDGSNIGLIKGRSPGKMLFNLKPVSLDGAPIDFKMSAKRNWTLALPSLLTAVLGGGFLRDLFLSLISAIVVLGEVLLLLTQAHGRRFGDQFAGTEVRSELD